MVLVIAVVSSILLNLVRDAVAKVCPLEELWHCMHDRAWTRYVVLVQSRHQLGWCHNNL